MDWKAVDVMTSLWARVRQRHGTKKPIPVLHVRREGEAVVELPKVSLLGGDALHGLVV